MSAFSIIVIVALGVCVLFDGILATSSKADEAARGTAMINLVFALLGIVALAVRG